MFTAGNILIIVGIGIAVGTVLSLLYSLLLTKRRKDLERQQEVLLGDAKREATTLTREAALEAKDIVYQAKSEAEKELLERRNELKQLDKRLRSKEESIERKYDQSERRDRELDRKEQEFASRERTARENDERLQQLIQEHVKIIEKASGMSSEEAKQELFARLREEFSLDAAKLGKKIEEEAKDTAYKKAREVIGASIQRYASDYISDAAVSTVSLPGDEMKGRIIGREGRNIRALEAATGIDLIIDDTPEVVILSGFDPVRRQIARLSLERLISDGRIHPARIEEVVEKAKKEVDATIVEEGEKAAIDLGLSGIHPELIRTLGRLKYRTSYGQNVLKHSREVAYLAGMMASELDCNYKLAKRAGLLHDIGKAVDHEVEGSHQEIGAKMAKKHGENDLVVDAILKHHGEGDPESVEAALVAAADALSAARPGVRSESIEGYIKRLEKLEQLAMAYKGVEKCYAIQAGRELRIIVKPEEVSDEISWNISRELAKKIEAEMTYPGQIKVTVIREARYVEYAK